EGGEDGHGVVVGGQGALRADVGFRITGARLLGRGGQDQTVRGLRRGRGQQQIAGACGAGDFVERLLAGRLAQQLRFGDLAVGVGGGQNALGGGLDLLGRGSLGGAG